MEVRIRRGMKGAYYKHKVLKDVIKSAQFVTGKVLLCCWCGFTTSLQEKKTSVSNALPGAAPFAAPFTPQPHPKVPAGCSPRRDAHMPSAASLGKPQKIIVEIHLGFYFKQH